MQVLENIQYKTAFILFGGIGGETKGLMRSHIEYGGKVYRFKILGSVDFDPIACHNHDLICGEKTSICMDLFTREQYTAWHGEEPPSDWREMTPWDMWVAMGQQVPFFLFTSPPCKGLSGLLPEKSAKTDKYQALNELTVRGIWLVLEACRVYGDRLPAIIQLENVPRIRTRGKALLQQIEKMLKKNRFAVNMRADHNLGKIGGLGQERTRFLIMSRQEDQVPNFIFYPEEKPLKSIGDVIGQLPTPGDTDAGGPLHRLPRLQWKTWVRLALIPAGGDWRDLNKIDWEQYRIVHEPRGGAYAVEDWEQPSRDSYRNSRPGRSNGASAISDPRFGTKTPKFNHTYRLSKWTEVSGTVAGSSNPNNGAICVGDPRLKERKGRHPGVYRIVRADEPAPCVTGTRFGSGALAIADPRLNDRNGKRRSNGYSVRDWDQQAYTVTGEDSLGSGGQSVSDPRVNTNLMPDSYGVQDWDATGKTVRGASRIMNSPASISDPRLTCSPRSGSYGVQSWDKPGKTVTGAGDIHSGTSALADPRIPADTDRGEWILIAEDGTWHRPLTTYELAMLQSFPRYLPDGRPFQLEGCSDAKAREYIGNAVPCDAAQAMGNVILLAAAQAEARDTFTMSWDTVWVAPYEDDSVPAVVH